MVREIVAIGETGSLVPRLESFAVEKAMASQECSNEISVSFGRL